jgi:hypothetical protein
MLKRETRARIASFAEERAIATHIVARVQGEYLSGESKLDAEREAGMGEAGELSERDRLGVVAIQALSAEKKHYWGEFYNGNLTEQAYKRLIQDIDFLTDHVKESGELISDFEEASSRESPLDRFLYKLGIFRSHLQRRKVSQIANHFEGNCAITAASRSVVALMDRLLKEGSTADEDAHDAIRRYYQNRHDKAQRELTAMATDYPDYVERTQEFLLGRSCLHSEETSLEMLRELGLVPDKVYLEQKVEIEEGFERLRARPIETLQLDPQSLLAQIPLFGHCTGIDVGKIASMLESESFAEGDKIVRQGESGDSMYVIARGTVKVLLKEAQAEEPRLLAILGTGGFFGEIALLDESPRTATVRAAAPCTMLRLRRRNLEKLMELSPETREAVDRAYKERLTATASLNDAGRVPEGGQTAPA